MILYFTGSGNSRFVAEALAKRLEDGVVSLNDVIKSGSEPHFVSEKPFVVVAPIYAWRLPRFLEEFLRGCRFEGSRRLCFVPTMGGSSGAADMLCEKLCGEMGMEYGGFRGVKMPDNYVVGYELPKEDEAGAIVSAAIPELDEIASLIRSGERLEKTDRVLMPKLMTGLVNSFFYRFAVSDKNYAASDACTGCGLCEKLCPMNNITVTDGKPVFGGNCVACYACIHHCPAAALDCGSSAAKHGRYVCREYGGE